MTVGKVQQTDMENMIKSANQMFHGVDKAVLKELVEAGAAMFGTGMQMLLGNYCVSDFKRLAKNHLGKDKSKAMAAFRASPILQTISE